MGFWRDQFRNSDIFGRFFRDEGDGSAGQNNTDDAEAEIQKTILERVINALSFNEAQKKSVLSAVAGVIHVAAILLSRAAHPERYDLRNSPKFAERLDALNTALAQAGTKPDDINKIDEEVLRIISARLQGKAPASGDLPEVTGAEAPPSDGTPKTSRRASLEAPLAISDAQIATAVANAKEASARLVFNDEVSEEQFSAALQALAEARAGMLRVAPPWNFERTEAMLKKRNAVLALLNTLSPDKKAANENVVLRSIIAAMDNAMGYTQQR